MEDHELIEDINYGSVSNEEKSLATFAHLGVLASMIVPVGNIILPLVLWILKKDESEYLDDHAKEALNFQITMSLLCIVAGVLCLVLIGIPMLIVLCLTDLVLSIKAAIKANKGEFFEYPINFRLIK